MNSTLYDLPDDVLIYKFTFLSVPDVLRLRKAIWTNAFKLDILANDYPFGAHDIDIEHRTCNAYRLASRWLTDSPLTPKVEMIFIGPPAYVFKFVPGHKWFLTLSHGSSSALSIWDITCRQKCSEWPSKSAMFTGMTINADTQSEASVAVSMYRIYAKENRAPALGRQRDPARHSYHRQEPPFSCPYCSDIMALSDDISKIVIYNWKTDECAYLDDGGGPHRNCCFEIVFTPSTILVISALSMNLYTRPPLLHGQTLTPVASHSFSQAYGASVPTPAPNNPLSILVRSLSSDNLSTSFKLYTLTSFPPILTSDISYRCRTFQTNGFMLGKSATAVWIHLNEHDGSQTLVAAVYPGPLNPTAEVHVRDVCSNPLNDWGRLDYDEDLGRIALGSTCGRDTTVIQL
ncbi:hypothetical protein ARMSODRAFT_1089918 [Armillaria solidipes]|uniref:F-box domain-containing protein n=1 Tax=Armillaria solidipes TaxID=1076256 RepID=A0A2H3BDB6_9AGAR|nr:hypothetical protein ARMSODRAFT_1089918 [Armillaria solidipes]